MYVVIRRSTVREGFEKLPRPKIVQEVLLIGSHAECQKLVEKEALKPNNQSTDQIEVIVFVTEYNGQKTYNSKEIRKDNGKRNTHY